MQPGWIGDPGKAPAWYFSTCCAATIVPSFLAVTIYWWDHNLRMSTVIGLVGGGGIGFLLIQYMNLLQYNQAATVLWMIVIAVTAMDYASTAIRSRLI